MATYTFSMRGEGLPSKDFGGSSDPYLVLRMPDQIVGHQNMVEGGFDSEAFEIGMEIGQAVGEAGIAAAGVWAIAGCAGAAATTAATVLAPVAISIAVPLAASQLYRVAKKLHKAKEGYTEIYSSEAIMHNLSPTWPKFQLQFGAAYHASPHAKLLIECWDWDRFSPSDFMGSCEVTVKDLINRNGNEVRFQLYDKKGRPNAGTLYVAATHDDVRCAATPHLDDVVRRKLEQKKEEEGERNTGQHKHEQQKHDKPLQHEESHQLAQQNHAQQYPHNNNSNYSQQYLHDNSNNSHYPPQQQYQQQYSYPPPNSFYPSHNDCYAAPPANYNNYGNNNHDNYQPPAPHNNYYGDNNSLAYIQKNECGSYDAQYRNGNPQYYNQQYPTQYPAGYPYQ